MRRRNEIERARGALAGGRRRTRGAAAALCAAALLATAACTSRPPEPEIGFMDRARAEMIEEDDVRAGVAILSLGEAAAAFDLPLDEMGVRPVWMFVENGTDEEFVFSPVEFDPDYLSPGEVAWRLRWAAEEGFDSARRDIEPRHFPIIVPPRSTAEGFVFAEIDPGAKLFTLALIGESTVRRFDLVELTPGFDADFLTVDFDALYGDAPLPDLDEAELRAFIEALPPSVAGPDGTSDGDPLNIVIVGDGLDVLHSFVRRGWDLTETITTSSALRTAASSVFGRRYGTSPVSPLFLFGRSQDYALQKARGTVDERNHLRLWLAPATHEGREVWVGQISRDIGVKLTDKTLVTHKVDPDVDEARNYLLFDLVRGGFYPRFALAAGVGPSTSDDPRFNYTDDPYVTDGYRVVLFHGGKAGDPDDVRFLEWEVP